MIQHSSIAYTGQYRVRTYEIDSDKRMTVPALVQLMQEAAMQNVIELKLSVWDLEPHHISWVLMRKNLQIKKLPMLGDSIKILTYPAGFEKIFTHRDFKIYDSQNQLIAQAATTWLLIDTLKRKMTRIPDFIAAFKMPQAEDCLARPTRKLPKFDKVQSSQLFTVNWHDLDFNEHLNNTHYIQWMLEALPKEVLKNKQLKEMNIQYRMECYWKDVVVSEMQPLGDFHFLHRLLRKEDGKELALGESFWSK